MFNRKNLIKVGLLWLVCTVLVATAAQLMQVHIVLAVIAGIITGLASGFIGVCKWDIFK